MIRFEPDEHRYFDGDRELVAVSRIIQHVAPKDWSGVDPEVREAARVRGVLTESHAIQWFIEGATTVPEGVDDAVRLNVEAFTRWVEESGARYHDASTIVNDGTVAGTIDLIVQIGGSVVVVDLKCTYNEDPVRWALQLAAYFSLYGWADKIASLHLNPRLKGGYTYRQYPAPTCVNAWNLAKTKYLTDIAMELALNGLEKKR